VTITLSVTNVGDAPAVDVCPFGNPVLSGDGKVQLVYPPPGQQPCPYAWVPCVYSTLAPGAGGTFTFTYEADRVGTVVLTLTANGADEALSTIIWSNLMTASFCVAPLDTVCPSFDVVAIYDPEVTDFIKIEITASEPVAGNKLARIEVHEKSGNVFDVTARQRYLGGNKFEAEFRRQMGFGEIGQIVVTGGDVVGNACPSSGSFTRKLIAGRRKVVVRNNVMNASGRGSPARIGVSLAEPSHVKVAVYTRRSSLVKVLEDSMKASSFEAVWNGVNAHGNVVPAGIYLVVVETNTFKEIRKIVVRK